MSLCSGSNTVKAARTILDDIGNMFDDLADQLDAMLDWRLFIQNVLLQPQEVKQRRRRRGKGLEGEISLRCFKALLWTWRTLSEETERNSSGFSAWTSALNLLCASSSRSRTHGSDRQWILDGSFHFFNLCNARVVVVSYRTWTKHRDRSWTSGLFSAHWEEKRNSSDDSYDSCWTLILITWSFLFLRSLPVQRLSHWHQDLI